MEGRKVSLEKIVSSNRNDQFAFIDPYPDKKELENEIKKMAIRSSRCTTSALYQINQTLKDCIKQAVPDLKDREVEHFIEMTSKTLDCSLTDYKNLVRMAQRNTYKQPSILRHTIRNKQANIFLGLLHRILFNRYRNFNYYSTLICRLLIDCGM